MARYDHIDFRPPQGAREAAKRALEVRAEKPESERGMTPVGIARARDLIAGKTLSPDTVRRMLSFFERHEGDKSGETWGEQGKGWQAWHGWGGDAGFAWARKVVRQMDAADAADKRMSDDAGADADPGVAVVLPLDDETAAYALPGVDGAHVTLAYLGRLGALPMGAVALDVARSVVARWASQTPPLPARLSGVGRFHGAEGEGDAAYLSVDAPGLSAARDALCRMLREAGLPVASSHGFTPHATLAYLPPDAPTPDAPCALPLALTLDAAAVWCGADRGAPCSLTGDGDPTTMTEDAANDTAPDDGAADVILRCPEAMPIAFADGGEAAVGHSTWNQIARLGEYLGHPRGAVKFTPAVFAEIVRNFAAHGNREVPLDYEHTSERLPESAAVSGVPAPGWVTRVEVRNGSELWALFKWVSADAVRYVRTGQYKYVSPAVNFHARDKASGKPVGAKLTSVALTNHPFLEGMKPLAADDRNAALDALITQVAAALEVPAGEVRARLMPKIAPDTAEGAAMAPHADTVHAPTTGAAPTTETPKMDPDEQAAEMAAKPATVVAADLPKMQPSAAPDAPADPAKEKADKEAVPMKRGFAKFASTCAARFGIAEEALEGEGAEDALIAKVGEALDALARYQEKEKAELAAAAATMAERVVAAGLADEGARETLAAMCLSQRATFDLLYPAARVEAAEQAKAAASVKLSQRGADDRRDAAAILAARITPAGTTHATANGATTPAAEMTFAQRRDALAAEIVKRDRVDLFTATERADAQLRAPAAH